MRTNILLTATAAALLSVSLPQTSGIGLRPAYAQDDDPEVTRMAKEHYKLGLDAFTAAKYDVAIKELKKAYLLKRIPAILFNIGLTYRKTKDYDMAIYFFKKFLAEAPPEDKQRAGAETNIGEIEAEKAAAVAQPQQASKPAVESAPAKPKAAVSPAVGPAGAAEKAEPGAVQAPSSEWSHTPLDAVPPGKPIDVRVQMPVMKGVKVKIYYRKAGQATFDSMELKRRGNEKVARLPQEITEGKTFQYYVEARDAAGTLVKSSGSEASPNIVLIDASARAQLLGTEAAEGPDDEELAKQQKKGFSRDIENEAVTFDPKAQQRALDKLRDQMKNGDEGKKKPGLSKIGWTGVGLMVGGVVALGGGLAMLGLANAWANLVTDDWNCVNKLTLPGGGKQCPHFGSNDDMNRALDPATASYDAQGRAFNTAGIGLTAGGGALLAGGTVLLVYDLLKQRAAVQAASQPKARPGGKKRKVKKVIEVEEDAKEPAARLNLSPILGPTTVGLVGEIRF